MEIQDFMMPPGEYPLGTSQQRPAEMPAVGQQILQQEGAQKPSATGMGFFDKLRSDPHLAQSMLMTGLRMMQGAKPGQNTLGVVGDAMMVGATAHNMLSQNAKAQERADAEFDLRKRGAELTMANTQQQMDQRAALHPQELERAKLYIKKLATEGEMDQAKLVREKLLSDPAYVRQQMDLGLASQRAQINQANSGAAANSALTAARNQELAWQRDLAGGTPEQVEGAGRALRKGVQSYGAKFGEIDTAARALMQGYGLSQQEAYAQAYEDLRGKKGEEVEVLKALSESGDPATQAWAMGELRKKAEENAAKKPGQKPASQVKYRLKPGADPDRRSSYEVITE